MTEYTTESFPIGNTFRVAVATARPNPRYDARNSKLMSYKNIHSEVFGMVYSDVFETLEEAIASAHEMKSSTENFWYLELQTLAVGNKRFTHLRDAKKREVIA